MQHSKLFIFAILLGFVCILHIILFFLSKFCKTKIIDLYFKRIFIFFAPIGFVLCALMVINSILTKKEYGITMEQQIKQQFDAINEKYYDTIILGNSRLYRGINPELLDGNCYNFAFDNDSFLECYYKLKYLETNEKLPKRIILGVDYFEFSFVSAGMQAAYDAYFDKEYDEIILNCSSLSFDNKKTDIDDKINKRLNILLIHNYYNAVSYLFNKYILKDNRVSYVSEYGQYRIYPQPKAKAGDFLTRSSNILEEQKSAYEKIFELCKQNNIAIIQVMLPLRDIEQNCYSEETKLLFNNMFSSNNHSKYLNYSTNENFSLKDFMDDTHLNLSGADNFTTLLNDDLKKFNFYGE